MYRERQQRYEDHQDDDRGRDFRRDGNYRRSTYHESGYDDSRNTRSQGSQGYDGRGAGDRSGSWRNDRSASRYADRDTTSYQERSYASGDYGPTENTRDFRDGDLYPGRSSDRRSGYDYDHKRKFEDDDFRADEPSRKRQYHDREYRSTGSGEGGGRRKNDNYHYSMQTSRNYHGDREKDDNADRYRGNNSRYRSADSYDSRSNRFDSQRQQKPAYHYGTDMESCGDAMEKMEVASNVPSEAGPSGEATDISAFEEQFPFGFVTLPPQEWSDYEEPSPLSPLEDEDLETGGSVADHDEMHDELLEKCNNTDVDGHAPNNTAVEE